MMALKIEPFQRAPLGRGFLFFGILLFLVGALWISTISAAWGFSLALLGFIFIIASLVAISPSPAKKGL